MQVCWLIFFSHAICAETVTNGDEQPENSANISAEQFLVTEEVRDRELSAEEDPLTQQQSDHTEIPEEIIAAPYEFRLYGSVRLRYRDTAAGTVWGYTGTGRAEGVIQARGLVDAFEVTSILRPINLNLQIQHGQAIPRITDKYYKTTIGLSSVVESEHGIGIAYNHADIDESDLPALSANGIDGDATALILCLRWFGEDWYIGSVVSRLNNHETTEKDIYYDGTGWGVYGQYRVYKQWWAVAGWNILRPDSTETQAGDFDINYNVVGVRYSFRELSQMIFANARLESSQSSNGLQAGNVYTIGVRWDLP